MKYQAEHRVLACLPPMAVSFAGAAGLAAQPGRVAQHTQEARVGGGSDRAWWKHECSRREGCALVQRSPGGAKASASNPPGIQLTVSSGQGVHSLLVFAYVPIGHVRHATLPNPDE